MRVRPVRVVGLAGRMAITLESGTLDVLGEVVDAVAEWQREGMPVQVHPGDLGWNCSHGPEALAGDLRLWRREGQLLAAGMVDQEDGLVRMALAPSVDTDEVFARQLVADLSNPGRVLPDHGGTVEARFGCAFRELLRDSGWVPGEPWTPLRRDLGAPVEGCGLGVEVLDAVHVDDRVLQDRVAVGRASFAGSSFSVERWHAMAAAPAYQRARCLVAYDADGVAVAATTVWSAGPGVPGLIEPLGVHRDHRGRGYGRAIAVAAASALRELGSSSATVCTPSSNVGGVAAYVSAGFARLEQVTDLRRPA